MKNKDQKIDIIILIENKDGDQILTHHTIDWLDYPDYYIKNVNIDLIEFACKETKTTLLNYTKQK